MAEDTKSRRFNFYKTVSTCFGVVVAVMTLSWIVWQASSSHQQAEIESLKQTLSAVSEAYDLLSSKTKGLSEPQLFIEDTTLPFGGNADLLSHGARVFFSLFTDSNGVSVNYDNTIDSTKADLRLRYGERFEFSVDQRPYYLAFYMPAILDMTPQVTAVIYELQPLYKPIPMPSFSENK